jgi:hypothetical protein
MHVMPALLLEEIIEGEKDQPTRLLFKKLRLQERH